MSERAERNNDRKMRRKGRGLIIATLIIVGAIALLIWLYGPRIMASLRGSATLPPEAASDEAGVLYTTSFDAAEDFADWELFDDSVIAARSGAGELILSINAVSDTGAWSGLALTFSDFALTVDAKKLEGPDDNAIFIVFSMIDASNYNRFDISSDGFYALTAVRDGLPRVISDWHGSEAIQMGDTTNIIGIRAKEGSYTFTVNGQTLPLCVAPNADSQALWDPFAAEAACIGGEITDVWQNADLPQGKIGLGAQGYTGFDGENTTMAYTVIAFESVTITRPD